MRWIKKVNESMSFLTLERLFPGYVFNKWVFRSGVLLILLLALTSLYLDGFGGEYVVCKNKGYDSGLGVYCPEAGFVHGDKPSVLTRDFSSFVWAVVLGVFGLNHILFNKKKGVDE